MTGTERTAAWLAEHPKVRYCVRLLMTIHTFCLWSVISAPQAAADVGAAAIAWTGLRDTDGVPLQCYFLSVVDTPEAVLNNGQGIDITDPTTVLSWTATAMQTAVTHSTAAWWLTNEAALLVSMLGISLWFLRFAMSSSWLLALAQIGRPVFAAVHGLVNDMWLLPFAAVIVTVIAGFHFQNGRPGRAWSLLGTAAMLAVALWTLFADPIDDLVSEHGVLGMGRATGFQIAQAARNGSYAPGQSLDGQLNAFLSQLISATARPALQLQNFGMVVDDFGSCRHAWSMATIAGNGHGPGPAHAMAHCGAPRQALEHAQQLGASDFVLGLFFITMAFAVGCFIWYVGISTLLVGAKATYYGIVVGPAIILGMTGWQRARNYATRAISQIFLHAAEMIIFTTYLAVTAVGMSWILTTPTMGHGGATVVPRLLMVGLGSIVAILLFHYIDKHFYTDGLGTIGHQIGGVWNSGRRAAKAEYDDYAAGVDKLRGGYGKLRGGYDRYSKWRSKGTDDDGEATTDDTPAEEHAGFDVVKPRPSRQPSAGSAATESSAASRGATRGAAAAGEAATAGEAAEVVGAAEAAGAVVAPEVVLPATAAAAAARRLHRPHANREPSQAQSTTPGRGAPPPDPENPGDWASDDYAPHDASLPPIPRRSAGDSRRTVLPPVDGPAPTHGRNPAADPAIAHDGADPQVDAPLEFSPTPTRRPANPTHPES